MRTTSDEQTYRIGALATRAGVSADTVRYYERLGVLPQAPRDSSGYRRFPEHALHRVRVIQRALDAGFTLGELQRVLRVRDSGGAPCHVVFGIASRRLRELEERIDNLNRLREELQGMLNAWKRALDRARPGERAGLLDAWAGEASPAGRRSRRWR
jgi:DNA-binding transcriptional MerR regulator